MGDIIIKGFGKFGVKPASFQILNHKIDCFVLPDPFFCNNLPESDAYEIKT